MSKSQEEQGSASLPKHIGFIVDGNRRWARERGLPTLEGHRKGLGKVEDIAEAVISAGVKFASFYIFSTENWGRSEEEVSYLMDLVRTQIVRLAKRLKKENIKCVILGAEDRVAPDILEKLRDAEELTKDGERGTVCICFNYGGKREIADAASEIVARRLANQDSSPVTIEEIEENIYHPEVPPCDLIVRTSGEERISGFMLWRAAYSEFLFLEKFFPDMETDDVQAILDEFGARQRRFGK